MNRIGIIGDSFADPFIYEKNHTVRNPISWPVILSEKFDVPYISGVPCTSIFYSYLRFLENYKNLDTIIFVATEPNRLYTSNPMLKLADVATILKKLENMSAKDPEFVYYKAAELYHIWLSEPKLNEFIFEKCVETIQIICQNEKKHFILIPGWNDHLPCKSNFTTSLKNVMEKEFFTQFGSLDYKKEKAYEMKRACHMSIQNNKILADLLGKIINGENITIGIDNFVFEKVSDPENYWELT